MYQLIQTDNDFVLLHCPSCGERTLRIRNAEELHCTNQECGHKTTVFNLIAQLNDISEEQAIEMMKDYGKYIEICNGDDPMLEGISVFEMIQEDMFAFKRFEKLAGDDMEQFLSYHAERSESSKEHILAAFNGKLAAMQIADWIDILGYFMEEIEEGRLPSVVAA